VLEDASFYLGTEWRLGPLIAISGFGILAAAWGIWKGSSNGERRHDSRVRSYLWTTVLLVPLLLHPLLANGLYFTFQNGYRDDWKAAASIVVPERREGDLVLSTLPPLADYYFGGDTSHIQSVDLDAELEQGTRIMVIEDWGVYKFFGSTEDWLYSNCKQSGVFDTFAGGRNFHLRTHTCVKS